MTVLDEIADERIRQINKGYDAAHDDQHTKREIIYERGWGVVSQLHYAIGLKGMDYRRKLIVVAALIVAEIDRLDRKALGRQP